MKGLKLLDLGMNWTPSFCFGGTGELKKTGVPKSTHYSSLRRPPTRLGFIFHEIAHWSWSEDPIKIGKDSPIQFTFFSAIKQTNLNFRQKKPVTLTGHLKRWSFLFEQKKVPYTPLKPTVSGGFGWIRTLIGSPDAKCSKALCTSWSGKKTVVLLVKWDGQLFWNS